MHSFTPSVPDGRQEVRTSSTATECAASYGLKGEWTAREGPGLMETYLTENCSVSRLAARDVGIPVDDERVVPAVRGVTAWPNTPVARAVVSLPNLVGVVEPLDRLDRFDSIGVVIYPELVGDLALPASTRAILLMMGRESVSLAPGRKEEHSGPAVAMARCDNEVRLSRAATAARHAQRLAKHVTQIAGVAVVGGSPSTGRFVISSPVEPSEVLVGMSRLGVVGGVAVDLPEYPGCIIVDCNADHDDEALLAYADSMATAVERGRRIVE